MSKVDYYSLLEISASVSDEEIKKAYRKLAVQYHPDRNPGDKAAEEKFKEINQAYQVLSDPQKRAAYDRMGHAAFTQGGGGGGFEGGFSNFSDVFDNIFGDIFGNQGGGNQSGVDLRYNLELTFEEAVFGIEKTIQFDKEVPCDSCLGSGAKSGTRPATCKACRGSGQVRFNQGFFTLSKTCTACSGRGQVIESKCEGCRGRGTVRKAHSVVVKVPAGVENEQRLRLRGEGEKNDPNGRAGDLFVFLYVKEHSFFKREQEHVLLEMPISFTQAALGAEIDVPTLEGSTKVKIPAGAQNGHLMRLKGKGIKRLNGSGHGDQVIQFHVEIPKKLSSHQKDLLRQFEAAGEADSHPGILDFLKKFKEVIRK